MSACLLSVCTSSQKVDRD